MEGVIIQVIYFYLMFEWHLLRVIIIITILIQQEEE